jgi:hypothetical protein
LFFNTFISDYSRKTRKNPEFSREVFRGFSGDFPGIPGISGKYQISRICSFREIRGNTIQTVHVLVYVIIDFK